MTHEITTRRGIRVSYETSGSGPPLVLVHGGFSNHYTNWEFVEPILRERFTLYAMARRNRGHTTATQGHTLLDEADDVVSVMRHIGEPVFLLGHSYGAQCALSATLLAPELVKRLVLYEPPRPSAFPPKAFAALERLAASADWDTFAFTFFRDTIGVPIAELEPLRTSGLWPPIVADAQASWGDICALRSHPFRAEAFRALTMPVCLQVGSESRHDLYVTDALAAELPDAHLTVLHGQAHEGMTTAPEQYAAAVSAFLLS